MELRNGGSEMEERICIRDSSKTPRKYGSTARHVTRNETLIKHVVEKTDTLQGIALKYGVTTEQIRRANKLWASDSLFLREYLLIPVSSDSPHSSSSYYNSFSESFDSTKNVSSPSSICSFTDEDSSVDDFLAKMDSSIAHVKNDIKKTQGNSEFCGEIYDSYKHKKKATARLRNSHPLTSSYHTGGADNEQTGAFSGDTHNIPSTLVMTQGRKVRSSLQRLEKEKDEMFQL